MTPGQAPARALRADRGPARTRLPTQPGRPDHPARVPAAVVRRAVADPRSTSADVLLEIHRLVGNRAFQRLVSAPPRWSTERRPASAARLGAVQREWAPLTPDEERPAILKWIPAGAGIQWYYRIGDGVLYFEIADASAVADAGALEDLAGPKRGRSYDQWLDAWQRHGWLTADQVHIRLGVERQTATARTEAADKREEKAEPTIESADEGTEGRGLAYTPEERIDLAAYLDTLTLEQAMTYLKTQFVTKGELSVPTTLAGADQLVGGVRKATARRLLPHRLRALKKVNAALSQQGATVQHVLVIGGAKDFVFPHVITAGLGSGDQSPTYHMVSGDIGNAEAIRKTVALYSPHNKVSHINTVPMDQAIKRFDVRLADGSAFTVICYDMLYDRFFALKEAGKHGIPATFALTIDQMSWIETSDAAKDSGKKAAKEEEEAVQDEPKPNAPWREYMLALRAGGFLIADHKYGEDTDWILDLLGLTKIEPPGGWSKEKGKEELFGYGFAQIYQKKELNLDTIFLVNAAEFYISIQSIIKQFSVSSTRLETLDERSRLRFRRGLNGLMRLLEESSRDDLIGQLKQVQVKLEIAENTEAERTEREAKEQAELEERRLAAERRQLEEELEPTMTMSATEVLSKFNVDQSAMLSVVRGQAALPLVLELKRLPGVRYSADSVTGQPGSKVYTLTRVQT